jgi:hypothetical protein
MRSIIVPLELTVRPVRVGDGVENTQSWKPGEALVGCMSIGINVCVVEALEPRVNVVF